MGHYRPSELEKQAEQEQADRTRYLEKVVQIAPGGQVRIVRQRRPSSQYQCWVVERLNANGLWQRKKTCGWDYLGNARAEMRGEWEGWTAMIVQEKTN